MKYEDYVDQQRRQYAKSVPIKNWRKQFKGAKSNQKLLDMVPKPTPIWRRALDIGAGEGYHTLDLMNMGYMALGIELLEKRVADAHKLGRPYVEVGDAHDLRFEDKAFDLIFMHEVLEHCVYPDKALSEIYRVLDYNGIVLISLPLEGHWRKPQEGVDHNFAAQDTHVWKPTVSMLRSALTKVGFSQFEIDLYQLGTVQLRMKDVRPGNNVQGFKPHAYVKATK